MRHWYPTVNSIPISLSWFGLALLIALSGCGNSRSSGISANSPQTGSAPSVGGASLGYVWGAGGNGMRQVRGVTGASYFGPAAFADFASAVSSGNARHAIAVRNNGDVALLTLPSGDSQDLTAGLSPTQHLVMSPSARAAVVYADAPNLLLITGLPDAPKVQTVPVASLRPISAVAVSDTGSVLLETTKNGAVQASSLSSDGTHTAIVIVAAMGGLSFLKSSDDALVADSAQNSVWLVKGIGTAPTLTKVASAADGVSHPIAVSASADGRWVIVANAQPHTILRIDLSRQQGAVATECPCAPSELAPLAGNAVFRLNPGNSIPVWVFDGDAPSPKTVFIPAPAVLGTTTN